MLLVLADTLEITKAIFSGYNFVDCASDTKELIQLQKP